MEGLNRWEAESQSLSVAELGSTRPRTPEVACHFIRSLGDRCLALWKVLYKKQSSIGGIRILLQ